MLVNVRYKNREGASLADQRRALTLFTNWTPPAGVTFQSHYAYADNSGGTAIVEADSAAALLEATAPFAWALDFSIMPVVEIMESVPLAMKAFAWIDSVK